MPNEFTIQAKPVVEQSRDSFLECARLKGTYLFDEIYIKYFKHHPDGVEILFDYERHHNRMRDVPVSVVSKQEFAQARQAGDVPGTPEDKRQAFARTDLIKRLFAEGARHYNAKSQAAEEDFAADVNFLDSIAGR
jgi:hypothetical protein